jgi:serine/threonine protein kinase
VPGYEILRELGRGGMGVVYKARQVKANRIVALKMILHKAHASPQNKLRFQIEAESVARLQHANIVQLFEVGECDDMPFFSLEFCAGGNLSQQLRSRPPSPREAAALVEKLARAIHYAHANGVLHRDLKPANVLLASPGRESGELIPKITDFGLAKQTDSDSDVSRSGAILGTPSYMAAEQAAGRIREVGPAADVYALGAILYQCLTGRPPFLGATSTETLDQVRHLEPVAPRLLRPKVPRDLETICLKCLAGPPPAPPPWRSAAEGPCAQGIHGRRADGAREQPLHRVRLVQ